MKKASYTFEETKLEEMFAYEFKSIGKQGKIHKIVAFEDIGNQIYNLVLVDYDPNTGNLDDEHISNNHDLSKVFATIFKIVADFLENHPEASIFVKANTETKRKLYNRIVERNFTEILQQYEVFGVNLDSSITIFSNINAGDYQAILIKKLLV